MFGEGKRKKSPSKQPNVTDSLIFTSACALFKYELFFYWVNKKYSQMWFSV